MCNMRMRTRDGFAMTDLLVMMILLFMVLTLAVPGCMQRVRGDSARTATMNNMSQCAKAAHLAHDQFKKFPPYYGTYGAKDVTPFTYHVHLLPYVDQQQIYSMVQPNGNAIIPAFRSTEDSSQSGNGAGAANFPVNLRLYYTQGGVGTLSTPPNLIYPHMPGTFSDGTSNTLLYATKYQNCGTGGSMWMDPGNNAPGSPFAATFGVSMQMWQRAPSVAKCDPLAGTAQSFTAASIQVAMCDASVLGRGRRQPGDLASGPHTGGGGQPGGGLA